MEITSEFTNGKIIRSRRFFKKYNINQKDFNKTSLRWHDLEIIYDNYSKLFPKFEPTAILIFNNIMKVPDVHSVRYRIKKLERVIEKIIRKRIEDPDRIIDLSNYTKVITDLIGIRALHLFKDNWQNIIILYPQPGIYMKLLLHIIGMEILKKL